ncbi:hypothetical protein Bca52824_042864 [Brassica carinata]|uniref:Uncharacterized protein n=1 Tax=Brassica carinata TaxID=52824 RepID=A0A8X7RXH5_BRACI|nr:hypothetical protein Bca52824_042864 [Brassica carinata]
MISSGLSYWITVSSNRGWFGKAFLRNKVIMNKNVRGTEEVSRLKSVNWTVPGRRESEGGRWKRTSGQEAIMDKTNKVEGYKESFVYYKKLKGKEDKTGWGLHDDLVLCYIRGKTEKKNNILSNQVQDEEAGAGDAAQLA